MPVLKDILLIIFAFLLSSFALYAHSADEVNVKIVYLGIAEEPHVPLTLLEVPIEDNGQRGAELALNDNITTGRFLGHKYEFEVVQPEVDNLESKFLELLQANIRIFITDLEFDNLTKISSLSQAKDVLLFNIRAPDDSLRNDDCNRNTLHVLPSRAMLADGLAQYLAWKRWRDWVLIVGQTEPDQLYAEAIRRAAKRFGANIVEEVQWDFDTGARRTDSGHVNEQQEVPNATQTRDYDIAIVADESDNFGEFLSYRTYRPRPVGGTQGLIPTAWHRSHEQWGGTQLQRRFKKLADRDMTPRDYSAWSAMRAIGEAVVKANSADPEKLRSALFDPAFKLAAFKGVPLTFRTWNGQMRQPILVSGPRSLITVSPQRQFLHERSPLDTLGYDLPESACTQNISS